MAEYQGWNKAGKGVYFMIQILLFLNNLYHTEKVFTGQAGINSLGFSEYDTKSKIPIQIIKIGNAKKNRCFRKQLYLLSRKKQSTKMKLNLINNRMKICAKAKN